MGTFNLSPQGLVNGRPAFIRDEDAAIWFASGVWCIGRSENMGRALGVLVSSDARATPDGISRWAIYGGQSNKITNFSTARCLSDANGAALAAAEAHELASQLSKAARTVYIVAKKVDKLRRTFCGAYNAQKGHELVNHRKVYFREGSVLGGKRVMNSTKVIWQASVHPYRAPTQARQR